MTTTVVVDDIATRAIRGGQAPDPVTGAILTPIYQTTTFAQESVGVDRGYTYSRAGNPTVSALERCLGELEDAPPAVCFSTGIAAVAALILAHCRADDHVVVGHAVAGLVRVLAVDVAHVPRDKALAIIWEILLIIVLGKVRFDLVVHAFLRDPRPL